MKLNLFTCIAIAFLIALACPVVVAQGQSVGELIKAYQKDDFASKTSAVKGLAHHRDPKGPLYLGSVFSRETDVVIRLYIIEQLVDAGTDGAGEALLDCARDPDEKVTAAYRKGIVAFTKKPGFAHMVKVGFTKKKGVKYVHVRKMLAELLGNIEHKGAIAVLKKALSDKDWEVRLMAAESLGEIGSDSAVREACRLITDKKPEVAIAVLEMIADFEVAKFTNYIIKGLYSKSASVRIKTLEVLAGQTDRKIMRKFADLVKDPDERVRKAAIEAMKWAQSREAIGNLIGDIRSGSTAEKEYLAAALKALTNQDFGTDHAKWLEWWDKNSGTAALAQPPRPTTSPGKATYFGTSVDSKNVVFIIDVSGSMSEKYQKKDGGKTKFGGTVVRDPKEKKKEGDARTVTKIEVAKKELIRCIKKLARDVKFNIIFYNQGFSAWQRSDNGSSSKIIPATPRNKRAAREFVMTFSPSGRTNIFDSLEFAMKDKDADTIYLLTDGMPNEGRITATEGIVVEIKRINSARDPKAIINTIGFGLRAAGKEFLKKLADQNGGIFLDK
jgi:hypothetical protein